MSIRLKDIALELKLDLSTVSRALRDDARVHPDTKTKVREAAARLGYRPNMLARRLAEGKTKTVWLLLPHLNAPIEREPAQYAADMLYEYDYDLMIVQHRGKPEVYERLMGRLVAGLADGALIIPGPEGDPPYEEVLVHAGFPLVFMDRHPRTLESIDVVTTDNKNGAYELTRKLIRRGVTHVFAGFYEGNPVADARREGCIQAMRDNNIAYTLLSPDMPVPDTSGSIGIISSSQPLLMDTAKALPRASVLHGALFDQWYGGIAPFQSMDVCVQDFKTMAEEAVRVLLNRIGGTVQAGEIRKVPPLTFKEVI
ncbi:MAG: LacI family DNA-binding transcriptional regulator [Spirochaetes bacterium]|nr:LacI family DNA-binding transcriptional regulator [Spirochaetota bacterium]